MSFDKKVNDLEVVAVKFLSENLKNFQDILGDMSFWINNKKDVTKVLEDLRVISYESIVVQKCNSVEIYLVVHKSDLMILKNTIFTVWKNNCKKFREDFFNSNIKFYYGEDAFKHIIETSLGIKSLTLGDSQVFSQLKKAHEFSKANKFSGPIFDGLFNLIELINNEVDTKTDFHKGNTCIERLVVKLVSDKFESNSKVALVGGGLSGELISKCLYESRFNEVYLFSRNNDFIKNSLKNYKFRSEEYDFLINKADFFDVIILSTDANEIFKKKILGLKNTIRNNSLVIDISVPSFIEKSEENKFDLYNLQDLMQQSKNTLKNRSTELKKVKKIVLDNLSKFMDSITLQKSMNLNSVKKRSTIIKELRKFLEKNDFIEIYSPKVINFLIDPGKGIGKEGIKVHYKGERFLAQSNQKFKQEAVLSGMPRVYEIGFYWRNNIHKNTFRHNSEFLCLDIERIGVTSELELTFLIEKMIMHLKSKLSSEVSFKNIHFPIPLIEYDSAVEILNKNKIKTTWGEDLGYKREKELWRILKEELGDLFFIYKYPSSVKKFYTKKYENKKYTRTFDLIFKGWEVCSGAIRENNKIEVTKSFDKLTNLDETQKKYQELLNSNVPDHGGFGFGIDRFVALLLDYKTIKSFYEDIWVSNEVI